MASGIRPTETRRRLLDWDQGQAPSEYLGAQVLQDQGFTDVDPSHPMGGRDGGADALALREGRRWVMACYFPQGQQSFKDIRKKLTDDYAGVKKNDAVGLVFVTNQALKRAERRDLAKAVDGELELFHLERLVVVLDRPQMYGPRRQFLGIDPPAPELDRSDQIGQMWRASLARCRDRWRSLGLPEAEARALADDPSVGWVPTGFEPCEAAPVAIWTGPLGSGKSIAAERHHQARLQDATENPEAPVPIFLRATDCVPDLETGVKAAAVELGQPQKVGASVVVDGVDEIGFQVAGVLLSQARTLTATWPSTTVVITSRELRVLTEAEEHRPFPPLNAEEQLGCVALGLGEEPTPAAMGGLSAETKATMAQPFFALLVGVWLRSRSEAPRAPIDLMNLIGEHVGRNVDADQKLLRRLARLSLSREFGPVAEGDVMEGARADELLASGLVERRTNGLAFVLPSVSQWFAAQAMLLDELDVKDLLDAPEDLELWREPLALAISLGSFDQAQQLLLPLFADAPGFAFRVLDRTFTRAVLGGATPPPWREGGKRIRAVLQPIADALQPASSLVADVDASGNVLPTAVASGPTHLHAAFWRGPEEKPQVFKMPPDVHPFTLGPGWSSARTSVVGPGASWAWQWAVSGIRDRLQKQLREPGLPVSALGPLGRELAWATACDVAQASPLMTSELAITDLKRALPSYTPEDLDDDLIFFGHGGVFRDLRALLWVLAEADADDLTTIAALVPPCDIWPASGGSIGALYSEERLVEAATAVYLQAFAGYQEVVDRWLPRLAPYLEHYVLMPVRLQGFLTNTDGLGIGPIPSLAGYFEALSPGQQNSTDIQMRDYDWELGQGAYQQQLAARPVAARWLRGGHGGLPLELSSRYPVAVVVQAWLGQDLSALGLHSNLRPEVRRQGLALDL